MLTKSKIFKMPFIGNSETKISEAKKIANSVGASINGNADYGSFSFSGVNGKYKFESGKVTVTVYEKPFYVPWSTVESELKKFFS